MEQSGRRGRRSLGLGRQRPLGFRTAIAGRLDTPGSRGNPAPRPGQIAPRAAGRQSRRQGLRRAGAGGDRAVGPLRFLPRRAGRTRRRAALRQGHPRGAARPELPFALSDRDRAHAQGAAHQQDRHRHARGRGRAAFRHARSAGGKPDADRRREHRRRRFRGVVEGQAGRRRRLSVQHPEPGRHGQGGGGKRHARGDRPRRHSADPDRRAPGHRSRGAGADAEDARPLRRRHPGDAGAVAEGRPAQAGDRRLPRRAGRAHRPRSLGQRGADLCQPRGAGSARQRGQDHPGRGSLQVADRGAGHRPDLALPEDLRAVQEGARRHPRAHVSGNHGARARRLQQAHRGFQSGRPGRGAVSAAQ